MAPYTIHDMTVTEARAAEQPLLGRLLQLYLHDFSEHAALGSPHGEVDGVVSRRRASVMLYER